MLVVSEAYILLPNDCSKNQPAFRSDQNILLLEHTVVPISTRRVTANLGIYDFE